MTISTISPGSGLSQARQSGGSAIQALLSSFAKHVARVGNSVRDCWVTKRICGTANVAFGKARNLTARIRHVGSRTENDIGDHLRYFKWRPPNFDRDSSRSAGVVLLRHNQVADNPTGATSSGEQVRPIRLAYEQRYPNSCGAAALLCIAKELGVARMSAYKGVDDKLSGGRLQLDQACERGIYWITSGMAERGGRMADVEGAGYSMPHDLLLAGKLLGLDMDVYEAPGILSKVLDLGYSDIRKELSSRTEIKRCASKLQKDEAELKLLVAWSTSASPVGLHWVVHRADGTYMDPATGENANSFRELQHNLRTQYGRSRGYVATGISIVARKQNLPQAL